MNQLNQSNYGTIGGGNAAIFNAGQTAPPVQSFESEFMSAAEMVQRELSELEQAISITQSKTALAQRPAGPQCDAKDGNALSSSTSKAVDVLLAIGVSIREQRQRLQSLYDRL